MMFRLFQILRRSFNVLVHGERLVIRTPPREIPKTIWTYWDAGRSQAPELVQHCIGSWERLNPDWRVVVLDRASAASYVAPDQISPEISVQHYSDLLRVTLLDRHGGVWVDATCLCAKPLDDWLSPLFQAGFFAFAKPLRGRRMGNWFLASEAENEVVASLNRWLRRYWKVNRYAHDYFIFHYAFEYLYLTNPGFRRVWNNVPKVSADGPHFLKAAHDSDALEDLDSGNATVRAIPMHKLNWRKPISTGELVRLGLLPAGADRKVAAC